MPVDLLENQGLYVLVKGRGVVKQQSLIRGQHPGRNEHRDHTFTMKLLKDILYKAGMKEVLGDSESGRGIYPHGFSPSDRLQSFRCCERHTGGWS